MTITRQAWTSPVEFCNREPKHDINESETSIVNPKFKDTVQGQNHPERCLVAEPEPPSFGKTKLIEWTNKMPNIDATVMMK